LPSTNTAHVVMRVRRQGHAIPVKLLRKTIKTRVRRVCRGVKIAANKPKIACIIRDNADVELRFALVGAKTEDQAAALYKDLAREIPYIVSTMSIVRFDVYYD
jgi:hypothetical protein